MLEIYFYVCNDSSDANRSKMGFKYDPPNLTFDAYDYGKWCKDKSDDKEETVDLSSMPSLKSDKEEGKEEIRRKILTENKLLTRLLVLLAKQKAGNNSNKLKDKIRQIAY